jgi:hypothetical protein
MTNNGEVYFVLFGKDFDPDEATRLIGLNPTEVQRKSDPRPKLSMWKFSSGKVADDELDVYGLSSKLISKLLPYATKIAKAKETLQLDAVLEVVLYITTAETKSTPAIGFDTVVISFLHAVGASIDVDTYLDTP